MPRGIRLPENDRIWWAGAFRSAAGVAAHKDQAKERRESNSRVIKAVKLAAGCIDCGYNEHSEAMDFDHQDTTTKKFLVGQPGPRHLRLVVEEVMKCDIRCANCHRVRHNRKRGQ